MIGRFFALLAAGAVLFALRGLVAAPEPLVVEIEPGEDVGEAILIDQAVRGRWYATDSVVRGHLVRAMRFAGEPGTDAELVDRGIALGLVETDPLIRARMLERARWALGAVPDPTYEQLEDWLDAHADEFRIDAVYHVSQTPREPMAALGPTLQGTRAQLAGQVGERAAAEIVGMEVGERRSIEYPWGTVDVRLHSVDSPRDAVLHEVENAVRESWRADRRDRVLAHRMALLREQYQVVER